MDVSESQELGGEKLVQTIVSLTGLPQDLAHDELGQILEQAGKSSGDLTLDDLRAAMLAYLESLDADMNRENPECSPDDTAHPAE